MAAFANYAGLVPPTSLLLLVRMALVARDRDEEPWYSEGYEALARFALGRGRHAALTKSDLKAVERAMEPLRAAGAVITDRRSGTGHTALYRLNLGAAAAPRNAGSGEPKSSTPKSGGQIARPHPDFRTTAPRKVDDRTPKSGVLRSKRSTEEDKERGALAVVLRLPSAESPVVEQPPPIDAQTITGAWVDHCKTHGVILPQGLVGRYGKSIRTALDQGFEPDLIKRALALMLDQGQTSWPGSFENFLVRVQEASRQHAASRGQHERDGLMLNDRTVEDIERVERLAAYEAAQTDQPKPRAIGGAS